LFNAAANPGRRTAFLELDLKKPSALLDELLPHKNDDGGVRQIFNTKSPHEEDDKASIGR
jgi:hypothetical protein